MMRVHTFLKAIHAGILLLLAVVASKATGAEFVPWLAPEQTMHSGPDNYISRLSATRRFGEGLGFDDGYATLEWFQPTCRNWTDRMLFTDVRAVISNDNARLGSNVGIVYRQFVEEWNRTIGLAGYWDTRYDHSFVFQQGTVGIESLGEFIDARAFAYLPFGGKDGITTPSRFSGNELILGGRFKAMTGGTAELGLNLPPIGEFLVSGTAGYYYFEDDELIDAEGWSAGVEVSYLDVFEVDVTFRDDDQFGNTTSVGIVLTGLWDMKNHPIRQSMRDMFRGRAYRSADGRLGERVRRLENIVIGTVRRAAPAADGGSSYNFLHVVDTAPAGGDGTFEAPYNTLTDALADPNAGTSIVYTPEGGSFTEAVTLVDGTTLWSNGPARTIATQVGDSVLPFSGTNATLTGLPGITGDVALASNSVLSGFDITGDVTGTGISSAVFSDNRVAGTTNAIAISGGSTDVALSNLELSATATGIQVDDSSVTVSNTTITMAGADGVEVNSAATDQTFAASNLTVQAATNEGVDLNLTGAGNLTTSVTGSTIDSTENGLSVIQEAGSTGDALVTLNQSTLSSTSGSGVVIDGSEVGSGTLTVQSFATNTVTTAATGGVSFNTATFDSDPSTAAIDPVAATSLSIGDTNTTTDVVGNGLTFTDTTGDIAIDNLQIGNDLGTGLFVSTKTTTFHLTTGADSVINTTNGDALFLDPLTIDLQFASIQSSDSPTSGILLDAVSGSLVSQSTTINGATATAIVISNTPAALDVNLGDVSIQSLTGPLEADNIDTSVNNGANLNLITNSITITE